MNLTDDLRHAVEAEGTPLKLIDPVTGETYVLVLESALERAGSSLSEKATLDQAQIENSRLLEIVRRNRPPQEWLEGDEEDLF